MEEKFVDKLKETTLWLLRSKHNLGGSSAHFNPVTGWSKPYPETTGYIIPTLLDYSQRESDKLAQETAYNFGEWLLSIQSEKGYWNGGLYPAKKEKPSVFNTGQILFGIIRLYQETGEEKWVISSQKGAKWLADNIGNDGLWNVGHYTGFNPTYYTRVAWPMLLIADETGDNFIEDKAVQVLDKLIERKNPNGTFRGWGFKKNKPAFTHTIAYTIRGFIEASILLDDWDRYGRKIEPALEKLFKLSELNNGRLAGAYDQDWNGTDYYTCLTGNVQVALCLMRWYQQKGDLQLLNVASKLIEYVNDTQFINAPINALNGAVAGSKPIWGRYMMGRYPNWSAKFHADALMLFLELSKKERKRMEHRGVVITAGFDKSMSAIAVAELLNRRDIPVHGFIVVSPYSWSRLRSYIKKRGISFLWEALPRLLGYKTAGSDKGKNYMKEYIEGKEIFYRSIKNWASNKGVDYCSVSSINDQHVAEYLKDVSPEWLVYCGGGIIRQEVIKTIGGQILNAHQGPLPEVRGMNAAEWSILLGENQEVTIHLIDQGIDTGDIITALPYSITPDDTIKTIRDKAKIKGIEGLVEVASKSNLDDYELRSNNSNYRQCYILSDTMKELLRRKLKYIQKQKV